jgi:hypothetical protein
MKNTIVKITKIACFALVAASLMAVPAISRAADTTNAPAKPHANNNLPYHGKVTAVDSAAMTFTIGEVYAISSTTKITKAGQPAVFADITVGENVSGSYKKDADGKNMVASVRIGSKKPAAQPDAKMQEPPPAPGK